MRLTPPRLHPSDKDYYLACASFSLKANGFWTLHASLLRPGMPEPHLRRFRHCLYWLGKKTQRLPNGSFVRPCPW